MQGDINFVVRYTLYISKLFLFGNLVTCLKSLQSDMEFKKKKQEEARKLKEMQAKAAGKGPLGEYADNEICYNAFSVLETSDIPISLY